MIDEYNNPYLISCMLHSLLHFGISGLKMVNRPIKVSFQLHTKHLMNLDDIQYKISKHHQFPFFVFNMIYRRQICLETKLTVYRSSNINERELLNKLQSIDFDEIIKNP
jgi:hypothetical protein